MGEENLARQAELALERQGDHDSLFYEGRWHSAGSLADRAARLATGLTDLGIRPADARGMARVDLQDHPLTASAALVWSGDLPRPLQQMLFDVAESLSSDPNLVAPVPR